MRPLRLFLALPLLLVSALALFPTGCSSASPAAGSSPTTPLAPQISLLNPSTATVGAPGLQLTVSGSNFTSAAQVLWNGTSRATTFVSSTQLTATITAADLAKAATVPVSVQDIAGTTSTVGFTVSAPTTSITRLSPSSVVAGGLDFTLQVTGVNFVAGATIQFNNTTLVTNFQSSTSLTATVPAAVVNAAGTYPVDVVSPGSGSGPFTSNSVSFTVTPLPSGSQVVAVVANDIVADNAHSVIYASVPSAAPQYGNSIVVINPLTGNVTASVFAGSEPHRLAISDDGQFLYVALDGSSSVQRFILPELTKDITVSLGADPFFGPNTALDLQVAPGSPHVWAVSSGNLGVSPAAQKGVTVYDDATPRPTSAGRNSSHGGFDLLLGAITFGKDTSTIIGANNESTGFDMYVLPITAAGVGTIVDYGNAFPGFNNGRIHFEKTTGYVYGDDGYIVNPANGSPVGQFSYSGPMVTDGALNAAFFINTFYSGSSATLASFDLTHFTPLNVQTVSNLLGTPVHLIRWGANGIAFNTSSSNYSGTTTTKSGKIYIISGTFVKP